jgi:hypothetical protein
MDKRVVHFSYIGKRTLAVLNYVSVPEMSIASKKCVHFINVLTDYVFELGCDILPRGV